MSDPLDRDPFTWTPEDIANVLGRLRDGKIKIVRNDDETKQQMIDALKKEFEKQRKIEKENAYERMQKYIGKEPDYDDIKRLNPEDYYSKTRGWYK